VTYFTKNLLEPEINTNRGEVALLERVIREATQERGLTDRAVADDNDFEEVVVLLDHLTGM
jgi:hypothetical protein